MQLLATSNNNEDVHAMQLAATTCNPPSCHSRVAHSSNGSVPKNDCSRDLSFYVVLWGKIAEQLITTLQEDLGL